MLEERINQDYVQAMKDRDQVRSSALSYLRAMIKQVKVDRRLEKLQDAEVVQVLRKQIKQRQDSIVQFQQGGRQDLADKELVELEIMQVYLPVGPTESDIRSAIEAAIAGSKAASIKDLGTVIKLTREKLGGDVDGRVVTDMVRARLSAM